MPLSTDRCDATRNSISVISCACVNNARCSFSASNDVHDLQDTAINGSSEKRSKHRSNLHVAKRSRFLRQHEASTDRVVHSAKGVTRQIEGHKQETFARSADLRESKDFDHGRGEFTCPVGSAGRRWECMCARERERTKACQHMFHLVRR